MAAGDAKPIPLKGVAYRVTFAIFDADGDLVTGAAGLDSEVSKDAGTFTDCTNEATEIATSSGMYYLDLTATEMDADTVAVIVKTSTSGAKTTPIVLYPEEAGDIRVNVTQVSGDGTAADNLEAACDGTGYNVGGGSVVAASVTGNVGGNVTGSIGSLAAQAKADVNAEVDTALNTAIPGSPTADSINERVTTMDGRILGTLAAGTHNAQSGDAYGRLGAPAGASVSADVAAVKAQTAAIETDTQDLQTQVGTDGAGLTALPWNAAWDAEVQSECADALNAYDPPTKAELDSAVANVSVDEIQATALADLFNTDSGTTYASAVAGSPVKEIADNAGGSGLTAEAIADAVWDEQTSGHADVGSTGAALTAAGSAGDPWSTALPGAYGAGTAGKLIGDNLDAAVSSRAEPGDAMALEADAVSASALSAAAVDEILDEVVEGTITLRQALRIFMSALAGLSTGGGTSTVTFRDVADTKARISATVDSSGNRTTITLDGS